MKRVFFVFLFLSLSLSEEQTKARKAYENSLAFKKLSFFSQERAVVSLRLFFFIFHYFSHENEKKKPNAFWSIQKIALTRRGFYISHRKSHFFFSVACSLALGSASRSVGKHTRAQLHTHTQSIIVSWRERCTCSPR